MTVNDLARLAIEACEAEGVDYLLTGAFAVSFWSYARSTMDVDLVLNLEPAGGIGRVIERLDPVVKFQAQVEFDTLTWGKRHIGEARESGIFRLELLELFDDAFVQSDFSRRVKVFSNEISAEAWLPTAEDLIVQKLRWARPKDLDDARDVIAVQSLANLNMDYIRHWCREHGSEPRLQATLDSIPADLL